MWCIVLCVRFCQLGTLQMFQVLISIITHILLQRNSLCDKYEYILYVALG